MIKPILQIRSPIIRSKAKPVNLKDKSKIKKLINDLTETMHANNLIGIAGPQIGNSLQIFITEIRKTKFRNPKDTSPLQVFINPKII